MTTFTTHSEGGGWSGGGTDVPNCSPARRTLINNALSTIQNTLNSWELNCLTDLRNELQDFINCSLEVDCEDCDIDGKSVRGSGKITLCDSSLDSSTQQRITAIVFHEMIHAAGGTELDAEALENHFFGGSGATAPTSDDWEKFHDDGGEFVIWDEGTGQLFEKCVEEGSWNESDTVTRGIQLRPTFIEPPSSGNGGGW